MTLTNVLNVARLDCRVRWDPPHSQPIGPRSPFGPVFLLIAPVPQTPSPSTVPCTTGPSRRRSIDLSPSRHREQPDVHQSGPVSFVASQTARAGAYAAAGIPGGTQERRCP